MDNMNEREDSLEINMGKSFTIQEMDDRAEMEIWCCNTHGGGSLCCGIGNPNAGPTA